MPALQAFYYIENIKIMKYDNAIDFLFNQLPAFERVGDSAYKPGLERVLQLSSIFGNPHKKLKHVIHIAGTNGKGSTAHTLASILQSAGYKTGLFTSPHLVDFRERIRVNGYMIPKERVTEFVKNYKALNLDLHPSFFELTTVLAFKWFVDMDVDIAVIEVGLGGRLDSTNIVSPDLTIITNISLDHTSLLGDSPESIAREKGGIIKDNVPTIIGSVTNSVGQIFKNLATQHNSQITFIEESNPILKVSKSNLGYHYTTISDGQIIGELIGDYQPHNASVVLSAISKLREIGITIDSSAVSNGFYNVTSQTGLLGRWMKLSENPIVICDTGHNPGGWEYLVKQINNLPGKKHLVIGFVADKDVETILEMIAHNVSNVSCYFTAPQCPRRLDATELKELAKKYFLNGDSYENVCEAYKKALANCDKGDSVFVGGSNYVIAELLESLNK